MNTVRTFLSIAAAKSWPLFQLDVNNAFLHGDLDKEIYITLPTDFYNYERSKRKVCTLHESLYGLKQASHKWFHKFSEAFISCGFVTSLNDYSLFTYTKFGHFIALLIYVDDVIITWTPANIFQEIKQFINSRFKIKDSGTLRYFFGIEVARSSTGIFINQRKYVLDLLSISGMLGCKPSTIPMVTKKHPTLSTVDHVLDQVSYRHFIGKLLYLTVTRPYISFVVQVLSNFSSALLSKQHT